MVCRERTVAGPTAKLTRRPIDLRAFFLLGFLVDDPRVGVPTLLRIGEGDGCTYEWKKERVSFFVLAHPSRTPARTLTLEKFLSEPRGVRLGEGDIASLAVRFARRKGCTGCPAVN